jgi:hypothetical protein
MTALEALEAYSGSHPESVAELLEWPYRRFRKAFSAWSRRVALAEWSERQRLHIAALYSNGNLDPEKLPYVIEQTEQWYEERKDDALMTDEDRAAHQAMMDTDFMRASKRSVERAIQRAQFQMPGSDAIARLP